MDIRPKTTLIDQRPRFPVSVRVAAVYLILAALFGLVFAVLRLGPTHPEFAAQPFAFRLGRYARDYTFNILYLVAGVYILRGHSWARKLAIGVLAVGIVYGAHSFAWGFAHGQPSGRILFISYAVVGVWNGFWIYLLWWRARATSRNEA